MPCGMGGCHNSSLRNSPGTGTAGNLSFGHDMYALCRCVWKSTRTSARLSSAPPVRQSTTQRWDIWILKLRRSHFWFASVRDRIWRTVRDDGPSKVPHRTWSGNQMCMIFMFISSRSNASTCMIFMKILSCSNATTSSAKNAKPNILRSVGTSHVKLATLSLLRYLHLVAIIICGIKCVSSRSARRNTRKFVELNMNRYNA